MKKRTVLKSAAALALTVVMLLALALPALAASGTGSITIQPNGQAKVGGAQRFTAYQIFKGTVGTDPNELVDLSWGEGVQPTSLVNAMKESNLPLDGGLTFGAAFSAAWETWNSTLHDELDEPEFVAQWLGKYNTSSYADDFARIVAANITGEGTKSDFSDNNWVISGLEPGYYLVKDNYQSGEEAPDGSVSSYILQVVGKATVTLKATIPTVTKKVEGKDGYLTGTDNKMVHFTLTGTVAENIAEYSKYKYEFVDTLSAGLTMDEPITDSNLNVKLGEHQFAQGTDYTVSYSPGTEGAHVLTITFSDLIGVCKKPGAGVTLDKDSKIVVSYVARLTKDAVVTTAGNPNYVTLKYSNDPYKTGEGETVRDEVKTYTIALNIVKKSAEENNPPLQDVGFKLKKGNQYAVMEKGTGDYWSITGWDNNGTEIKTDSSGQFSIHGLDRGTYSLVETSVPKDYEKMKDIVFDIEATVSESSGELESVTLTRDSENESRTDVNLSGEMKAGTGTLTLTNFKSPILPHTGGIGAKVVYIVSGMTVLAGAAIVVMAMRKRTRGRHEQSR